MENVPQQAGQNRTPTAPPAPPAYGTHEEWRAWRRQQREYYRTRYGWAWWGMWGWFWAIAMIVVGGYYLLVNLGLMTWVRGDLVWPLLLIVLGLLVLVGRFRPWRA